MWSQFVLVNLHFALSTFSALAFFAIAWLYFDAWSQRKTKKDFFKILGFVLISVSFILHATYIETTILTNPVLGKNITFYLVLFLKICGLTSIALGLLTDPIQSKPSAVGPQRPISAGLFAASTVFSALKFAQILLPALSLWVALLYLKRSTAGLEKHLKMLSISFFGFALFEFLSLSVLFENTQNIDLYNIIAPYKPLWIITHLVLITSSFILIRWGWSYLLKRLLSQLFMIYTATVLAIFLLVTVSFTFLLLKNLQQETSVQLQTDVKVLSFAIDSKKAETLSDAQLLAQNTQVAAGVLENSRASLSDIAQDFLLTKKESTVAVTDKSGRVLARGEDRQNSGDSLSDDPLVRRALRGESVSSIVVVDGVLAPSVAIRSASPIKSGDQIAGSVIIGSTIDNAFVDGVKKATGLQSGVYGDNKLSATTILMSDGRTRANGIREENAVINSQVLGQGEDFSGTIDILNTPYFGAYSALFSVDNKPVGMLFVGKPQIGILQAASKSIETTFLLAAVLLMLSIAPAYLIARYITNQLR